MRTAWGLVPVERAVTPTACGLVPIASGLVPAPSDLDPPRDVGYQLATDTP